MIGVFAGEAALRVWAAGPADVEMERAGASEYMAMLTAAGTYTIKATLDGAMLPGQPLLDHYPHFPLLLFARASLHGEDSIATASRLRLAGDTEREVLLMCPRQYRLCS